MSFAEPEHRSTDASPGASDVARPLVIVVAEPSVYDALAPDADLELHPQRFSTYEAFLAAARNRQVPLERTPVVIVCSDALPVEGDVTLGSLVSMVRDVAVVITWAGSEHNGVIEVRGDVSANAIRKAIAARTGVHLAARVDGDAVLAPPALPAPPPAPAPPLVAPVPEPQPASVDALAEPFAEPLAEPLAESFAEPVYAADVAHADATPLPESDPFLEAFALDGPLPPAPPITPDAPQPYDAPVAPPARPTGPPRPAGRAATPKFVDKAGRSGEGTDDRFWDRWVPAADGTSTDNASDFSDLAAALAEPDNEDIGNWKPRSFDGLLTEEITGSHGVVSGDAARPFDLAPTEAELAGELFAPAMERDRLPVNQAQIVAVYSPKGGVGKTSISTNLASRLALRTNLQVCIVDLDLGFGNVGTRLGLFMPTVRELIAEGVIDNESVSRNLAYDSRTGLHALLAPLRPDSRADSKYTRPEVFDRILRVLAERFDVIILDCPVELTDPIVAEVALKRAHRVLMVLNNEQATLIDGRRAIETMCRPTTATRAFGLGLAPSRIGIVVNQKVDGVGKDEIGIHSLLSGEDTTHPAHAVPIITSLPDDRVTWVRNANLGRPVATDGATDIDESLDAALAAVLPGAAELLGVPLTVTVPGIDDVWIDPPGTSGSKRGGKRS